jgi:hypothetical protein
VRTCSVSVRNRRSELKRPWGKCTASPTLERQSTVVGHVCRDGRLSKVKDASESVALLGGAFLLGRTLDRILLHPKLKREQPRSLAFPSAPIPAIVASINCSGSTRIY